MKIRLGFVSNSSSSSFCIMGFCLSTHDARELLSEDIGKHIKKPLGYIP